MVLCAVAVVVFAGRPINAQTAPPAGSTNQQIYNQLRRAIDGQCGDKAWDRIVSRTLQFENESTATDYTTSIPHTREVIVSVESCIGRFRLCPADDLQCDEALTELNDYALYALQVLRHDYAVTHQSDLSSAANQQEFKQALTLCEDQHINDAVFVYEMARDDLNATFDVANGYIARGYKPPGLDDARLEELRSCARRIASTHLH